MKKCLICGHVDESGEEKTCCKCGEATWAEMAMPALSAEATPAAEPTEPAKPKRGRPRGS